jgi:small subunit ribosomal protein S5
MSSSDEKVEGWKPRTRLGKMIIESQISSIEEVFTEGLKIREPEIVDVLFPDLQEEVINISLVQKQTDAGEKSRFRAIVVVGNRNGYVGLGSGKAKQVRTAMWKTAFFALPSSRQMRWSRNRANSGTTRLGSCCKRGG